MSRKIEWWRGGRTTSGEPGGKPPKGGPDDGRNGQEGKCVSTNNRETCLSLVRTPMAYSASTATASRKEKRYSGSGFCCSARMQADIFCWNGLGISIGAGIVRQDQGAWRKRHRMGNKTEITCKRGRVGVKGHGRVEGLNRWDGRGARKRASEVWYVGRMTERDSRNEIERYGRKRPWGRIVRLY